MANIELPKDAEGREIPLDTKLLYDKEGNPKEVSIFSYTPRSYSSGWSVVLAGGFERFASAMFLNPPEPPDSWERLEDDLDRAVETGGAGDESFFQSMACAYMNRGGEMCGDCKFLNKYVRDCTKQMLEDVVSRIRKLRGDD